MNTPPTAKLLLLLTIGAALLLATGAVFVSLKLVDPIGSLFDNSLAAPGIAMLLVWSVVAWAVRRLTVGELRQMRLNSTAALVWGGSRVVLLLATVTVMICWLVALAFGLAFQEALVRSFVLLLLVSTFTGIFGGAFINSMLALKRVTTRRTE